jgi:hypothetical protein
MGDIPQLKKLWCECFPEDSEGYCDFFFEHYFRPERCIIVRNDTEIESAGHLFDAYYKSADGIKRGFMYLYATGTLERYRGCGNLKLLIEGCLAYCRKIGYSGITVVATDELVCLYDRYDCKRLARVNRFLVTAKPDRCGISWRICPFERFSRLRTAYLDQLGNCFYWCGDSERYMYDDVFTKGSVLECSFKGETYYAVCTREPDRYVIRETSFPLQCADAFVGSIAAFYDYSGMMEIYSRFGAFGYSGQFTMDDLYYGHYRLESGFDGQERLGEAYINLIGD